MLINFRTENYLTFDETETFSTVLGQTKRLTENVFKNEKIDLLRFSAVYGSNASGKSNFVDAIRFSREIILEGMSNIDDINKYNKNNPNNENKETKFEYEILVNNKIFSYGFAVRLQEAKISYEWLYEINGDEEIEIYSRDNINEKKLEINFKYFENNKKLINRLNVYSEDALNSENELFLTELNKNKSKIIDNKNNPVFNEIYNWFQNTLEVISPQGISKEFAVTYTQEEHMNQLGNFLRSNGTGIEKVQFKECSRMDDIPLSLEKKIREDIVKNLEKDPTKDGLFRGPNNTYKFSYEKNILKIEEIVLLHGNENIPYKLGEESDGTRRLIDLFSIISSNKEKVFIVDEIDRSLHPLLTYNFIKEYIQGTSKGQLIVTTHEDRLLDLNLLRRDQIWFMEKNVSGNSSLYSLEEFKERFDKNILNAYLEGRYGAIPKLESFYSLNKEG